MKRDPGSPSRTDRLPSAAAVSRHAFTLMETAIVLSIIAFAVIPLVGSLVQAWVANAEARSSTEIALVLQTCTTLLHNQGPDKLGEALDSSGRLEWYFADSGQWLGGGGGGDPAPFYRCTVTRSAGAQSHALVSALVTIAYPAPDYRKETTYPVSVFRYGTHALAP